MKSIRKFLTLLLIASLVLVVFSAAIRGYKSAINVSSRLLDKELQSTAQVLSQLELNSSNLSIEVGGISAQIWRNGDLLVRSSNAPVTPMVPFEAGFRDKNFAGARWRVHSAYNERSDIWVFVGQPLNYKFEITESLVLAAMVPFLVAIPILALVVFWGISRAMNPLNQLEQMVSNRDSRDLSALSLPQVPEELEAIVETLNSLFFRLQSAFDREKQFSANAAHELRTPLSVMKINLHNLAKNSVGDEQAFKNLQADTDRMIQVVNQILLLSRTSPELFSEQITHIDPYQITQTVIADTYPKIAQRMQDIELIGKPCSLLGTEFTLSALVKNLIDNASKYSPLEAQIRVTVEPQNQYIKIIVEDSGPGIAPEDRPRILSRFARDQKTERQVEGAGLGLAIVGQIIDLYEGYLCLGDSELGGLSVTVKLPHHKSGATSA